MLSYLHRLFTYNAWANKLILDKILILDAPDKTVIKLFSHILASEKIWFSRIEGVNTSGIELWPNVSPDMLESLFIDNRKLENEQVTHLKEFDLDTDITYTNSAGIEYHTPLKDILTHLVIHNGYHRGQLALEMRKSSVEPVNTDFITFVRQGG
ncbi:MAG: DinB family protein [Balneolales bacterium]